MKSFYLLYLFLFIAKSGAADIFAPFYGNYQATQQTINACLNGCNTCCVSSVTITQNSPNISVNINLSLSSGSLSRCGATTTTYNSILYYTSTGPNNNLQTSGTLSGFETTPTIGMNFLPKPSTSSTFNFNSGSNGCSSPVVWLSAISSNNTSGSNTITGSNSETTSDSSISSSSSQASTIEPLLISLYHLIF